MRLELREVDVVHAGSTRRFRYEVLDRDRSAVFALTSATWTLRRSSAEESEDPAIEGTATVRQEVPRPGGKLSWIVECKVNFDAISAGEYWLTTTIYARSAEPTVVRQLIRVVSYGENLPDPIVPNLELYLPMNEAVGAATVKDYSGHNRHGAVFGPVQLRPSNGKYFGTASFRASIPHTEPFIGYVDTGEWNVVGSEISAMAWIFPNASNTIADIIMRSSVEASPGGVAWNLFVIDLGTLVFGATVKTDDGTFVLVAADFPLTLATWQHVGFSYDGSELQLWLNGILVARQEAAGALVDEPGRVFIGMNVDREIPAFRGSIDEVRVYSDALRSFEWDVALGDPDDAAPTTSSSSSSSSTSSSSTSTSSSSTSSSSSSTSSSSTSTSSSSTSSSSTSSSSTSTSSSSTSSSTSSSSSSSGSSSSSSSSGSSSSSSSTSSSSTSSSSTSSSTSSSSTSSSSTSSSTSSSSTSSSSTSSSSSSSHTTQPTLEAWYRFEETGSPAQFADSSGHDRHAVNVGASTGTTAKEGSRALDLNGVVGRAEAGTWWIAGNQLTVTCWIRCIDFADTFQRVLVKGTAAGDPASTWLMFSLATGQTVRFRLKTTAGTTGYISVGTLDLATWHHLALVYDGAEMRFYIDGVFDQAQSKTGDLDSTAGIPIVIGAQAPSGGSEFAGQIDDVRFYRTALTAEEIADLAGVEGADLTPPSVPAGLSVSVLGPTSLLPDWSASTDAGSGVLNYDVERNGSIVAVVPAASTFYHDQGLTPSTLYSYRIRARDVAGNLSAYCAAVAETTDAEAADIIPPSVPGSLTAESQGSDSILVDWAASTDAGSGVLNYDVQRDGVTVAVVAHPTTEYLDEGLTPSTSYTYRVRARDVVGNVSAFTSNVVESTGAAPPPDSGEAFREFVEQSITTSGRTFVFRFTFDKPYWTGRFVTGQDGGDWWAIPLSEDGVEPYVRIISVTPAYVDLGGGHMQNGTYLDIDWLEFQSKQPFANPPLEQDPAKWNKDTTAGHITNIGGSRQYNDAMRVKFNSPVDIVPNVARGGTSVVHCRSKAGLIADRGHGPEEKFSRPFTSAFCVLTVLPAAPAPGSFRPTWAKHTKTIYNISQVRKSLISNLRLANPGITTTGRGGPSDIPTLDSVLAQVSSTWLDYMGKQTTAQFTAAGDKRQYHGPCLFGGQGHDPNDINLYSSAGYLRLLLDRTAEEEAKWDSILYNLIQIGIDYYGWVMTGATWGMTTGHQGSGLAFNINAAGIFLNSAPMMAITGDTSLFPGTSFPSNHVRFHEIMKTTPFIEDMRVHGYTTQGYPTTSPGKWPELIPATIPTTLYRGTNWPRIVQCDQKHGISAGAGVKYNGGNWRSYVAAGTLDSWLGFGLLYAVISETNPAVDARALFGHEPLFLMIDDAIDRLKFSLVTVRSQNVFLEMMWDTYRSQFDTEYPIFAQAALPAS